VLDYGIGNLRSAQKALERAGADARLTADPDARRRRRRRGAARRRRVRRVHGGARGATGLDRPALDAVASGRPFLGICVGMQLLYEGSEETPGRRGLGVLPGTVRWLPEGVKRPQMQWNVLDVRRPVADARGLDDPTRGCTSCTRLHAPDDTDVVVATCDYGGPVNAAVERDNVFATQFHPEKSGSDDRPGTCSPTSSTRRRARGAPRDA
jgi:imidazole glycerol-phosphate synthase subunit HisH